MARADDIGGLRQRLSLQQEVRTPDGGGGFTVNWTTVDTVWAEVMPLSGRERLAAMQVRGEVTHRVRLRHRQDIAPDHHWRLVLGERVLNVQAVINVAERGRFLELLCQEGAAV